MPTKPFTPSPYMLNVMIERAMAACDHDVDQSRRAEEARRERRSEQAELARGRAMQQAATIRYWQGS